MHSNISHLDTIIDYLSRARRYDNYICARCPFHDDHNPSFFVYPDKYYCKSCGAYGDTSTLKSKLTFVDEPQHTSYNFNNPWTTWCKHASLPKILKSAWITLCQSPSIYLQDRGISYSQQKKMKLGIRDNWITFPVTSQDNKVVGAVARAGEGNNSKSKYIIPSGQQSLLYTPSWKSLREAGSVFLTFGMLDIISLHILGADGFSTTQGQNLDVSLLKNIRKPIYIFPDRGEVQSAKRLASKLGWRGKVISRHWEDNCKDANDLLVKYPTKLKEIIKESKDVL